MGKSTLNRVALGPIFAIVAQLIGGMPIAAAAEEFSYPELTVVPRASDRLKTEAERESEGRWLNFLPLQISAASTLLSGIVASDSNNPGPSTVGIGIGGGWLAFTVAMSLVYHPYSSGYSEVSPMAKGSTRDLLARERAAEEELKAAARFGETFKWLSVVANLGSSIYILSKKNDNSNSNNSTVTGFAFASAALSLMPIIFPFHWGRVWDQQSEYKKKIYAPVARALLFQESGTKSLIPGIGVSLNF